MKVVPVSLLDTTTRWIAAVAAGCAIGLSAYLATGFNALKLPANITAERLSTESIEATVKSRAPREPGLAASGAVKGRPWFTITVKSDAVAETHTAVAFAAGLVVPDALWLLKSGPESLADPEPLTRLDLFDSEFGRYVILPSRPTGEATLLARISSPGVGQPKVRLLRESDVAEAESRQLINTASYTAIFLILACFSAAVAASSRDWTFLLFCGWLLTSLRMVAVNGGWGFGWLEAHVPSQVLSPFLAITLSAYGFFTIALFRALLRQVLAGYRVRHIFLSLQIFFLALAVLAPVLPSTIHYLSLWLASGIGISLIIATSFWIAVKRRHSVAAMLFTTWTLTMAGMTAEILYNVGVLKKALPGLTAETGALAGALVCAFALAHRLKAEILARRDASDREIAAATKLKRNYDSMPLGLFGCDSTGAITIFNPAFADLYQAVTGTSPSACAPMLGALIGERQATHLLRRPDGESASLQVEAQNVLKGQPMFLQLKLRPNQSQFEGTVEDVTARVNAERSLARLVDHDAITKALNQRGLNDAVQQALSNAANGIQCSLIEVDIDRFKTLNDLHGHLVGDQILAAACDRIIEELGPRDSVARIGDSFRVVIVDRDPEACAEVASRIHLSLSTKPMEVAGRLLTTTASIGIVTLDPSMSVRDAIAASSQACADAKLRGRNRVVHFGKQDIALRGYLEELKVQANLQDRINSQRFFLEFQPIVSIRSAFEMLNYEVLVRMRGEDGATISPARFIPAAERNGQMSFIDRWVLTETIEWLERHPDHLRQLTYATINLSGSSLNDARFVDSIFALIAEHPAVMQKLCFEITETVALADRKATRSFSERVHSFGGKVALDDFGAGYTSFTYLREIDADIIKIDGSFVRDINQNPANHAITRMIVDLSHELGKRCVAEWAEQPDVIATLMQLGVDYAQGYALARPMRPESLVFAGSCGDLVTEPSVRTLLKGGLLPEQVTANPGWSLRQPALF